MTARANCAKRGCSNPVAAPGGHPLTMCAPCLLGFKRIEKQQAQFTAVCDLPPMEIPSGAWGVRMPGSPRSWNNALVRPRHGKPYLARWAREWKEALGKSALKSKPDGWPMGRRYWVEIRSWFATNVSDADGPVKLVLDAFTGIAWNDDRQVAASPPWKEVDPIAPRLEVIIRVLHPGERLVVTYFCAERK